MSEVATEAPVSQPPPAADGGDPWGSFYTAPSGAGERKASRRSAKAKPQKERRKHRTRPRAGGNRKEDKRASFSFLRRGSGKDETEAAAAPEPVPSTAEQGLPTGELGQPAPQQIPEDGLPPVAAPAHSRRYAEPHVLVGVVGGTLIALAALMIALLYMIGSAA